jgi:urea transport system permease protein
MITRFLWQGMTASARVLLLVLAIGIACRCCNQLLPAGSALLRAGLVLQLIGKYLCYASLALAVDLVWGFCGILTLGHAAFLALGRLLHGHVPDAPDRQPRRLRQSVLPDFMCS